MVARSEEKKSRGPSPLYTPKAEAERKAKTVIRDVDGAFRAVPRPVAEGEERSV